MATGCKPCAVGAERCGTDGSVMVCGTDGLETVDHSCPNGCTTEVAGPVCNACLPNAERCGDDGNVLVCGATGTESVKETCANGCFNAACKTCATGALSCSANGAEVLECDATGVKGVKETCVDGCYNNACKSCATGALSCSANGADVLQCDATGVEGIKQTCANGCYNNACKTCAAGALSCSASGDLLECDATGAKSVKETCSDGCKTGGPGGAASHCAYLQPKYLPDACDTPSTTDLMISADMVIDPGIAANCNGGLIAQATPDAKICVIHYKNITVAAAKTLTLRSMTAFPAVALVADSTVDVSGTLDASAVGSWNGPGAGIRSTGLGLTGTPGGAGGATVGGAGCGGTGGAPATPPLSRVELRGGDAGGGGGGGAITLISCHGTVRVMGAVMVNGGGGPGSVPGGVDSGGFHYPFTSSGGGGAGGVVVLQGMSLNITGKFYANGGGGGENATSGLGDPGQDGGNGAYGAPGGYAGSTMIGGAGGYLAVAPKFGNCASPNPAGSGGGSVGFFAAFAPSASQVVGPTGSPAFPVLVNPASTR